MRPTCGGREDSGSLRVRLTAALQAEKARRDVAAKTAARCGCDCTAALQVTEKARRDRHAAASKIAARCGCGCTAAVQATKKARCLKGKRRSTFHKYMRLLHKLKINITELPAV